MDILAERFLGVSAEGWLILLGTWAIVTAGLYLIRRLVIWRIRAIAGRTKTVIDDVVVELVQKTHLYFLLALGLYLAALIVIVDEDTTQNIRRLAFIALLVQTISWGNYLITDWIARYRERKLEEDAAAVTSMQAVGFLARLAMYAAVVLMALDNFGIDITALIAGLGIGGIAVALALQSILGDLFASLSIVLDKPFVVGDFLIVNEYLGSVEAIGLKTTRVRSLSGEQIIFSNSDLLKSRIRNYKRMFERRVLFTLGVVYQTPREALQKIPDIIRTIIESQDRVRFDRAHFKGFGSFSLDIEVVYYVLEADYNVYMDIQQAINLGIYRRFEEEGIEFAYPTQTLFVTPPASPAAA